MASSCHMVDELEKAFQNSLALLTSQEHFNVDTDTDEIKSSVEQSMQKLIDCARQLDVFFLQRRLALCGTKTDSTPAKEDLEDLRFELQRKDALIQKHSEKLQLWQNWFKSTPANQGGSAPATAAGTSPGQGQAPQAGMQQQPPPPGPPQQGSFTTGVMTAAVGQPTGYSQGGPLAYLEQTTSSIGLPRIS